MSTPLLEVVGLQRPKNGSALWGRPLAFELAAGESLAVRGPSGSGKTTLLRLLAGLEPIDEGSVSFKGRAIEDWDAAEYRARIAFLAQKPPIFPGTVLENLKRPFKLQQRKDERFDRELALERLRALDLSTEMLEREMRALSVGETQAVSLVRATMLRGDVMLLDEPTSALDERRVPTAESLVADWMRERFERACIWVTHDAQQAARVATREVALEKEKA